MACTKRMCCTEFCSLQFKNHLYIPVSSIMLNGAYSWESVYRVAAKMTLSLDLHLVLLACLCLVILQNIRCTEMHYDLFYLSLTLVCKHSRPRNLSPFTLLLSHNEIFPSPSRVGLHQSHHIRSFWPYRK